MSNRKESLKKSLGITDYPWSSDEENETEQAIQDYSARRQPEARASVSDVPGTSGQSSSIATPASSRRLVDRELLYSFLNRSRRTNLPRDSRMGVPVSPIVRPVTHVPVPEARGSTERVSPTADVTRIIAFRNINRFANNRNYKNAAAASAFHRGSTARSASGTLFSTSNASLADAFLRGRRRNPVQATNSIEPRDTEGSRFPYNRYQPRMSLPPADIEASTSSAAPEVAPAIEPISIEQSDDEPELHPEPLPVVEATENNNIEQDIPDAVDHNASTMSLEEEIVEIDADPEHSALVPPDGGDSSAGSLRAQESVIVSPQEAVAATSAEEPQQPHGVKRKRDALDDSEQPSSVKEFNQNLLRLLECPVCLEWMEPPMSQCRRGHLVCGRCRARLASCPVCRTAFSSVRNRAMEGVAEMLRYPCRHGCGREVRLRRRTPHEASCSARRYRCVVPACADREPMPHRDLAHHFQNKHLSILKIGHKHKISMKVNSEHHDNWLIMALHELFHLRIDVDIRTWGVVVYVAYLGPMCNAENYTYEISVAGQQSSRRLVYTRTTHCDLESSSITVSRQDCFHLTIDQALNFLRVSNRLCEPDKYLNFTVLITKNDVDASKEDSDS